MNKNDLAKRIRVSAEELETAHINDFNKKVLLELSASEFEGDVDDKDVEKAEEQLKTFLTETWPEEPQAHKYVINACLALAFLFERPMHPQEKVHYTSCFENGKEVFYCSYNQKGTVCDFCAADPPDNI